MQKHIRTLYIFGNLQETSAKDHPSHCSKLFGSTPTSDPTLTKYLCYEKWTRNIRTSGLSRKVSANFGIVTDCQNFRARMNSGNVHDRDHLVTVPKPAMSHARARIKEKMVQQLQTSLWPSHYVELKIRNGQPQLLSHHNVDERKQKINLFWNNLINAHTRYIALYFYLAWRTEDLGNTIDQPFSFKMMGVV